MSLDRCRVCKVEMEPDEGDLFDFLCDRCLAEQKKAPRPTGPRVPKEKS